MRNLKNLVSVTSPSNKIHHSVISNNEKNSLTLFSSMDRAIEYRRSYNAKEDVRNRYNLPISKQQLKECKAGEVLGYDLDGNLYTLVDMTNKYQNFAY